MFKTDASADIAGLGGIFKADFSIASIILTENLKIDYCPVHVLDYPVNYDMVIGMNIINIRLKRNIILFGEIIILFYNFAI